MQNTIALGTHKHVNNGDFGLILHFARYWSYYMSMEEAKRGMQDLFLQRVSTWLLQFENNIWCSRSLAHS